MLDLAAPFPESIAAVDLGSNSFHLVVARTESGERHSGHHDVAVSDSGEGFGSGQLVPFNIGGYLIEVDTTCFTFLEASALCARIRALLATFPIEGLDPPLP